METNVNWALLIEKLSEPFPVNVVSWRAGRTSKDGKRAQALPYAEPRAYEDRLNQLCPGDWSVLFKPWGEHKVICELTLFGVVRSSTGEYEENTKNTIAQGTVAEAQAFKRACSKFGLGRYLYDLPVAWVGYDETTRRLTETPSLPVPVRAEPKPPVAAVIDERATDKQVTDERAAEPTGPLLSARRADAMGRELEKLGFASREQRRLAERVLGHEVAAFSGLTEAEALEVWNVARRSPPKAAPRSAHAAGL